MSSNELSDAEREALEGWAPLAPTPGFADRVLAATSAGAAPVHPVAPRRSGSLVLVAGIVLALAAIVTLVLIGIRPPSPTALAEITRTAGPIERQEGSGSWDSAAVGTKLYLGDAARTADGGADLVIAGSARISMQPHTVLRFGGDAQNNKISVELGSIDLYGTGHYGLEFGDVTLAKDAGVRITARGNNSTTIQLVVGDAKITNSGETIALVVGTIVDLRMAVAVTTLLDAGVVLLDAALPPFVVDAGIVSSDGLATVVVTGGKAEIQSPGETGWRPLPPGAGQLLPGRLRIGNGTTAKVTKDGITLELANGTRLALGEDGSLALETGRANASAVAGAGTALALPGGTIALASTASVGSEARLDVGPRDTKVSAMRGASKLVGTGGGELAMNRGESATLARNGTIRVIEAIPSYYDLVASTGDTFTIHDPRGATAVRFAFGGKCGNGGFVEIDRDARFRTAHVTAGADAANAMLTSGSWAYRLRCSTNGGDGPPVASGRIAVYRDSGNRALPRIPATNQIDADGRNYRISYQSIIPTLVVRATGTAKTWRLHVASGGKDEAFDSKDGTFRIPGAKFSEGSYTYWVERDGVKDTRVSTLTFSFDNTAPQVYIESPKDGAPASGELQVRGAVLPDWTASVDGITIPMDRQRRFAATVNAPSGGRALVIQLSHPQRGKHLYLRRLK